MEIKQLIQAQYFGTAEISLQPVSKGEENQNFYVSAGGSRFVLRLYSPRHSTTGPRSRMEIEFELNLIDFARSQGVPTPEVILTRDGEKAVQIQVGNQTRYAALFGYVEGAEAAAYTEPVARSIVDLLIKLRKVSRIYPQAAVRKWPGDMVAVSLNFYHKHRQQTGRFRKVLDPLYQCAVEGYRILQKADLPRGILHGDIKLGNLLFVGDEVKAVLDFDDYRESYLLEEFARTLLHDLDSPTRNAIRSGCYGIFYEALENDPSISTAELAHLKTFLRARLVYDQTTYIMNGNEQLVEAVFADKNIAEVIG